MSDDLTKTGETALAKDMISDEMKQALLSEVSSQIDARDITFPSIKIIHAAKKFEIENLQGGDEIVPKAFSAVILSFDKYRVFFEKRYDPQNPTPPDCFSLDNVTGTKNESYDGAAGGVCATCPQNQWGTAISASGEAGKGKACQEKIRLFLMMENSSVPFEMHLSPTSVGPFKKYIGGLIARLQYPQLLWTEFSLTEGNMNSAVLVCTRGPDMSADDAERWKEIRGLFGATMQKKDIQEMNARGFDVPTEQPQPAKQQEEKPDEVEQEEVNTNSSTDSDIPF